MPKLELGLLILLAVTSFFSFRRDKRKYEDFSDAKTTEERQRFYKSWTFEPFLQFGLFSLIVLFVLGKFSFLSELPEYFRAYHASIQSAGEDDSMHSFLSGFIKALKFMVIPFFLVITPIMTIFGSYYFHKKAEKGEDIIDKTPKHLLQLIPKNFKERVWGFWLSLNAGFSEELFFRVLLPYLFYAVSGSAIAAIILSTLWFGVAHYYQGIKGILATTIAGFILFFVYLLSGSLWLVILVHAVIDLNSLTLAPWMQEFWQRKRA